MREVISCAAIVAVVVMSAGCSGSHAEESEQEYAVLAARRQDVTEIVKYPALIQGRQDVEIYPQITGKIISVNVSEGQRVKKGDELFVIDQVPYLAALQTAEADLKKAKADVSTARLDYEGKKRLFENNVTSMFDVQKSENTLYAAEAAVAQAEAKVTEARNNLSYTVIASPCDGVIGTVPYRSGALVSPSLSSPLTEVSDNSEVWVYFSIPENRLISLVRQYGSIDSVLEAMPDVRLYLNDGSEYGCTGQVESVSGVIDSQTGSVSLRAVFQNETGCCIVAAPATLDLWRQRKTRLLSRSRLRMSCKTRCLFTVSLVARLFPLLSESSLSADRKYI